MARRTVTPLHLSEDDKRISELEERTGLLLTDVMTLVAEGTNFRSPLSALLEMLFGEMQVALFPNAVHFYGTAGVQTWTKPASAKYYGSFAAVIGPGGPGGGITAAAAPDTWAIGASGGGGGGLAFGYYATEDLGPTEAVTIGAFTSGAVDGTAPGSQGTSSSFTTNAATLTASGGNPGSSVVAQSTAVVHPGGAGGVGEGSPLGDWAEMRGAAGGFAITNAAVTDVVSGFGGGAPFFAGSSGGIAPLADTATAGTDGFSPGQGGAGAAGRGALDGAVAKGGDGRQGFGLVVDLYSATR